MFGIGLRHPHYREFAETKPSVDFVEVHAENFFAADSAPRAMLRQVRQNYPVSLHGVGLSLGGASGLDAGHLASFKALVDEIDPVVVSDHACFGRVANSLAASGTPFLHANDLLPPRHTQAGLSILCDNVSRLQDTLQRRIAVENLSVYVAWRHADMEETTFLNTVCERTGCGVLLDVNNVYVNTHNASLPIATAQAWIERIKPEHVMEIHVAGCTEPTLNAQGRPALMIDDHAQPVNEAVWGFYAQAIRRSPQAHTLVEWDLNIPPLGVLLGECDKARAIAE